jgi:type IV pilus assembly protein PilB
MSNVSGIARQFVEQNLLNEQQAQALTLEASKENRSFIMQSLLSGACKSKDVAILVSSEFGLPILDLAAMDPEHFQAGLISAELLEKHKVLPIFKRGNRLHIAQADPSDISALDDVKFATGMTVDATVVEYDKLNTILEKLNAGNDAFDDLDEDLDLEEDEPKKAETNDDATGDEAPIVRFVNKMLLDAIKMGSSDLHFEPYEKRYRVRYRTDGILHEVSSPPINLAGKIAARLKVMSQMDISERRVPQDGRIKMKISKTKSIDFRVNSLPTLWGEKLVLRILDSSSAQMGIEHLGYEPEQKQLYLDALAKPQGMILVTGPTGSGKTVSLYTGLNILNVEGTNISTAEDPVEINLEGINQVNVNAKVGLDFGEALKAFLRQDPDIVMVGEIRDLDTASIAIKAAQTGHLVLSTLHTNSAPETLTRLANMGVPAFNLATSVSLIIAQRLGRRLCSSCKVPADIPESVLLEEGFSKKMLEGATINKAVGCEACTNGYKGRVGIYEVMKLNDEISRIIMDNGNAIEIADASKRAGFDDLRKSALKKVAQGITSLEEANRVTSGGH